MPATSELVKSVAPMLEMATAVIEAKGEELRLCYQCGTCTAICPWGNLKDFNPRKLIEMVRLGFEGFEDDSWRCVTCKHCWDKCPNQINIPQLFQAVRSVLLAWNACPPELKATLTSLRDEGNPWQQPKANRGSWIKEMSVPVYEKGTEHLLFTCCTNDFDPRNQLDARAAVELLRMAGVSFGYAGNRQVCCGDIPYTVGENELFAGLQEKNQGLFAELDVKKIITLSPHCQNAFKNRYEYKGGKPSSVHLVELLAKLVKEGTLKPQHEVTMKATYHDPCYLGRYNGIYDEPRAILAAIPGLEFIEMNTIRENSFCCGGGGGGGWLETLKGERLGDLRVCEAMECGAEVIVTACPYCVQMLEASILGLGIDAKLKVKTVSEVLLSSLKNEVR